MDNFKDACVRYAPYIGTGLLAVGTTVFLFRRLRARKPRVCGVDYPRDKVILYPGWKGAYAPSLGHFNVKLETYLKMAKIPYEANYEFIYGPKKKFPWVEYNGVTMGDSQLIINYLNKEFNIDFNKHLSPTDRATAWAIQKWLEEFTYWLNVHSRWVIRYEDFFYDYTSIPSLYKSIVRKRMAEITYTVGVGRHSDAEIDEMMKHDLMMLSEILGTKKFLMGDQPAEVDCAAFGILSQIRWHTPDSCPGSTLLKEKLTNLVEYCDRMKETYWEDWDEKITGKPRL